jgi:hypothetical protein
VEIISITSCSTHQLIELYDNILLGLGKKQITSITFADISKTFDTVWIKALTLKLEKYDIKDLYKSLFICR